MTQKRVVLTRAQILAFRRHVGALNERLPPGPDSFRIAAWAGLQDSMPRAALLSIQARVAETTPTTWEDPSLAQLWGPRFSVYVVAQQDLAVFSLGRLAGSPTATRLGTDIADQLEAFLAGRRTTDREAAVALGNIGNRIRYAGPTGRVVIRWEGARAPLVWTVSTPSMAPVEAALELARRYLHIFGPTDSDAFAHWAGISPQQGRAAFDGLMAELTPVRTPIGDRWILTADEPLVRTAAAGAAPARLLPSGDAYWLLQGTDRELMVPDAAYRNELWTKRVWPGALLVHGEIVGTWRRNKHKIDVSLWRELSPAERTAVEAEAASLPLPGDPITIRWD